VIDLFFPVKETVKLTLFIFLESKVRLLDECSMKPIATTDNILHSYASDDEYDFIITF